MAKEISDEVLRQMAAEEVRALKGKYRGTALIFPFKIGNKKHRAVFYAARLTGPPHPPDTYLIEALVPGDVSLNGRVTITDRNGNKLKALVTSISAGAETRLIFQASARVAQHVSLQT
jgi:hypothetical protein